MTSSADNASRIPDPSLMPDRQMGAQPRLRLAVAIMAGVIVAGTVWAIGFSTLAPLAGWIAVALTFCGWTWAAIWTMAPAATASHATREVPGRAASHLLMLAAAGASLIGIGAVFVTHAGQSTAVIASALACAAVVASWLTVHTVYTLRYARLYYLGTDGGVDFHQAEPPCYTDFAYLALTIGMSFAVSDTDLGSSQFRKVALGHAILAYTFGTVFVAVLVNLLAGLAA